MLLEANSTLPVAGLSTSSECACDPLLPPSGVTKRMASPLKKFGSDSVPLGVSQGRSCGTHQRFSQICSVCLFL